MKRPIIMSVVLMLFSAGCEEEPAEKPASSGGSDATAAQDGSLADGGASDDAQPMDGAVDGPVVSEDGAIVDPDGAMANEDGSVADDDGAVANEDAGAPAFEEEAVFAAALAYRDNGFVKVTVEPRRSQHMGQNVNIWVQEGIVDTFLTVDPENLDARPVFPVGSIIVKEHLRDRMPDILTVMAKANPGYDAERSDWYWLRIRADGTISHSGQVNVCIGCHTPRADTDWVYGVPLDNRPN